MCFSSQLPNPPSALYPQGYLRVHMSLTTQACTCFVDLQKASDPWNIPWGCLGVWGVWLAVTSLLFPASWTPPGLPFISDSIHIFMDRICRCSQVVESFLFSVHKISFLPSSDDVVLLPSAGSGIQLALEQFAAKCGAAGMRTSKSEAMEVWSQVRREGSMRLTDGLEPNLSV